MNPIQDRIPRRWRVAGWVRRLPDFRGRDRLTRLVLGKHPAPRGVFDGSFGPELRFRVRYEQDTALRDMFFLQYEEPALAPVLDRTLSEGDVFFDVGANVGVYSAYGASIVGSTGQVHAFEPSATTAVHLRDLLELNQLENVTLVPEAVSSVIGSTELHSVRGHSGIASITAISPPDEAGATVRKTLVPTLTLDHYASSTAAGLPRLVKIDVEGHEFEVLQGARRILRGSRPPVVIFETGTSPPGGPQHPYAEIVAWLEHETGFRVYGMTPRGLVHAPTQPLSLNSLALHPSAHRDVLEALRRRRFRRNQNC